MRKLIGNHSTLRHKQKNTATNQAIHIPDQKRQLQTLIEIKQDELNKKRHKRRRLNQEHSLRQPQKMKEEEIIKQPDDLQED